MTSADCYTVDVNNNAVLVIGREYDGEQMVGVFNFSGEDVPIHLGEGTYTDLVAEYEGGNYKKEVSELTIKGNSFFWLKKTEAF